jgi:SAM-dependent methyltransferase
MFSPQGPSARELAMQALSSVEGGYDLLAPKFDHTPFRTPGGVLDAAAGALRPLGPFGPGLDVCCGTGAGMRVLTSVCQGRLTGVDFSAGMLAQARRAHPDVQWVRADVRAAPFTAAFDLAVSFGALGHFLPAERPALFAGVYRALRPGGVFAFPLGAPAAGHLTLVLGSSRVRPGHAGSQCPLAAPVRHVLPDLPAARGLQRPDSSRVHRHDRPLDGSWHGQGRQPAVPARPRAQSRHALTAAYAAVREPEVASITEGNFSHSGQVNVSPIPCSAWNWMIADGWRADRPFMGSQGLLDRPAWRRRW